MKWLSFRIRAISVFSFDTGRSTRRCFACEAFRIRVSMSAIGSVIMVTVPPIVSGLFPGLVGSMMCTGVAARTASFLYCGPGARGPGPGTAPCRPSSCGAPVVPPALGPGPGARRSTLPAGLPHSRNLTLQAHLPETDTAQPELAQERARAAAAVAAVAVMHLELRLLLLALDQCLACHPRAPQAALLTSTGVSPRNGMPSSRSSA